MFKFRITWSGSSKIGNNKISDLHIKKIVMITGAGDSIGSELCRQILNFKIKD